MANITVSKNATSISFNGGDTTKTATCTISINITAVSGVFDSSQVEWITYTFNNSVSGTVDSDGYSSKSGTLSSGKTASVSYYTSQSVYTSYSYSKLVFATQGLNCGNILLDSSSTKKIGINGYVYYSFTPNKSGNYTLTFTNNSSLKGWISTNTDDNSASGATGGEITQNLSAGVTYYLGVKNTTKTNYTSPISNTLSISYNPPITYINYVYNGSNTRKQKEGNSYDLDPISSLGYMLDGWTFAGWNTEAENNNIVYQDSGAFSIQEDTTEYYLYPVWKKNFSITYRYGYPDILIERDIASIYSYERYTNNYEPLETATYSEVRVLYTTRSDISSFEYDTRIFSADAWYVGNTTQYVVLGKEINISSDTILNCGYSSNNLSLLYNGNDEKVQGSTSNVTTIPQIYSVASQTFQVRGVAATECGFTLSGKKFKEWNISSDGSGTSYKAGDIVKLSVNTTLYAIWINADEPFIFLSNKQVKPYLFKNNKYYEIKFM